MIRYRDLQRMDREELVEDLLDKDLEISNLKKEIKRLRKAAGQTTTKQQLR